MQRNVPVHKLRPNEREYTPASVIFMDTETVTTMDGDREVLTLSLWCAEFVDRRKPSKGNARRKLAHGRTADELVMWIERMFASRQSISIYAHNLSFDLSTTRLPMGLVIRGWTITDCAIGGKTPWLRMRKGKKTMVLTDSSSYLPRPLDVIGQAVGVPKQSLPRPDDTIVQWLRRCRSDVTILRCAMLDLMAWWDRNKLGNWTITGPSTGWNAYRHRDGTLPVVIDPDPEHVRQDRKYVHGGRRGVWSIGSHAAGPFYELDFTAAHPTIAANMPLPSKRSFAFPDLPDDHPLWSTDGWDYAARCLISTETARYPVRVGNTTWHPIGQFWTHLAGPEIREARRLGNLVKIGPGRAHKTSEHMADWGQWVLRVQHGEDDDAPAVARIAAKDWGRSVIGKWSSHGFERTRLGPSPNFGWGVEELWDTDNNCRGTVVDIAGTRWQVTESGIADNAYPAVHAWVESEVRLRLARVIDAIGEACILRCDTDGMIVAGRVIGTKAAHGHLIAPDGLRVEARLAWVLNCLHPVTAPLWLRVKVKSAHVTVLGPQHIVIDGQRSFAGLRADAKQRPDGGYEHRSWPGLAWQLAHGDARGFVRPLVRSRFDGPYPTGWILRDRTVVPPEMTITDMGGNKIVPWHLTRYARAGLHRADVQHPDLDALI